MVAIFPTDGLAWGVGVVIGAVIAGLILFGIALCMRKVLCPPQQELQDEDPRFEQTMPAAPREADPDAALEIESTGSQDEAPKFVADAFGDSQDGGTVSQRMVASQRPGDSDDDDDRVAHSDRGGDSDVEGPPPHTVNVRNVVMRRTAAGDAAKRWRY